MEYGRKPRGNESMRKREMKRGGEREGRRDEKTSQETRRRGEERAGRLRVFGCSCYQCAQKCQSTVTFSPTASAQPPQCNHTHTHTHYDHTIHAHSKIQCSTCFKGLHGDGQKRALVPKVEAFGLYKK